MQLSVFIQKNIIRFTKVNNKSRITDKKVFKSQFFRYCVSPNELLQLNDSNILSHARHSNMVSSISTVIFSPLSWCFLRDTVHKLRITIEVTVIDDDFMTWCSLQKTCHAEVYSVNNHAWRLCYCIIAITLKKNHHIDCFFYPV